MSYAQNNPNSGAYNNVNDNSSPGLGQKVANALPGNHGSNTGAYSNDPSYNQGNAGAYSNDPSYNSGNTLGPNTHSHNSGGGIGQKIENALPGNRGNNTAGAYSDNQAYGASSGTYSGSGVGSNIGDSSYSNQPGQVNPGVAGGNTYDSGLNSNTNSGSGFASNTNNGPTPNTGSTFGTNTTDPYNNNNSGISGNTNVASGAHHGHHHGTNKHGHQDESNQNKPSFGDKLKGTMEQVQGKIQKDPSLVAQGQERKTGNLDNNAGNAYNSTDYASNTRGNGL